MILDFSAGKKNSLRHKTLNYTSAAIMQSIMFCLSFTSEDSNVEALC